MWSFCTGSTGRESGGSPCPPLRSHHARWVAHRPFEDDDSEDAYLTFITTSSGEIPVGESA
ncbi:hypothetical protein BC826DRAFT_1082488 [Russula brevipes]|nr:hypothetical protein BC826DRAFT_1082488 [Russula brevipes]